MAAKFLNKAINLSISICAIVRLKSSFVIRGTALRWFSSYLYGHIQWISLNAYGADAFDLQEGVPQESCLGLLSFTLYAVGKHPPSVYTYADDTQLYLAFKPESASSRWTKNLHQAEERQSRQSCSMKYV